MLPYALYFLNTISVAFLGCVDVCISCTVSKVHICAVVRGVRLYFSSAPLLTSTSQLFSCDGRTCVWGSSAFGVWTGGREPLLAVEHKTAVESSMKNNYSLGLQNSMPVWWYSQRQPTTFSSSPPYACWDKNFYRCIEVYKCRQIEEFRINSTPGSTWLIAWTYSPDPGESCLFLPWHLLSESNPWTYSALELDSKF